MRQFTIGIILGAILATGAGVFADALDTYSGFGGAPPSGSWSGTVIPGGRGLDIYNDNKGNSGTVLKFENGMQMFNFQGPAFGKSPC